MKITVNRFHANGQATLSLVAVNGRFACFGLEDAPRRIKIPGQTRIPAGSYRVTLRRTGGFHGRYGARFAHFHQGMLWVQDVPGFEYILIHCGNSPDDTAGCLLLGAGASAAPGAFTLQASARAYTQLYQAVAGCAAAGNLTIDYLDGDKA